MLDPTLAAMANMPSCSVMKALYSVRQLNGLAGSFSSHLTRIGVGDVESVVFASSPGGVSPSRNEVPMSELAKSPVNPEDEIDKMLLRGERGLLEAKTRQLEPQGGLLAVGP